MCNFDDVHSLCDDVHSLWTRNCRVTCYDDDDDFLSGLRSHCRACHHYHNQDHHHCCCCCCCCCSSCCCCVCRACLSFPLPTEDDVFLCRCSFAVVVEAAFATVKYCLLHPCRSSHQASLLLVLSLQQPQQRSAQTWHAPRDDHHRCSDARVSWMTLRLRLRLRRGMVKMVEMVILVVSVVLMVLVMLMPLKTTTAMRKSDHYYCSLHVFAMG